MSSARALLSASKKVNHSVRTFTSLERIKELQRLFSKDDGVPVHLKRGLSDRIMYQTTMFLCVATLVVCAHNVYTLIYPKKKA